ncbi:hypothetical protein PR202_gb29185 [Eleusine coracana subsp. coracana]|uniref:Uncharacterized protein n=1 Tax=Eleusine coracana subsp. coracana TaxID=191504 RepID=A0AAV5FYT2_ELECO|nr:hypothetical protein PR202_gb29185 [Eleusine coracana subsp. coracana]
MLWDLLLGFALRLEEEDKHYWRLCSSGQYSTRSAYTLLFMGATQFGPWERTWSTWAPSNANSFYGW